MPVSPTQAYALFKAQSEALLDFAVLVAYAVPALRDDIALVASGKQGSLLAPDFFHRSNRSTPQDLTLKGAEYEQRLAATVLITHFSFFESFVTDIIREMIEFHGGKDAFLARIESRSKRFLAPHEPHIAALKRKLQDSEKRGWQQRYRKYAAKLDGLNFRFPGELLAAYGVRNLLLRLKRLRAVDIPDLLAQALRVDLSVPEVERFHQIRELRNRIAHGGHVVLSMNEVVHMNLALRDLAIKVATHLTENFFVIEKYAP